MCFPDLCLDHRGAILRCRSESLPTLSYRGNDRASALMWIDLASTTFPTISFTSSAIYICGILSVCLLSLLVDLAVLS